MYLNCHSYYSLKYGLLSPHQLVNRAAQLGITHLALTDINNTSCMIEFITTCRSHGINPVAGIEFRQDDQFYYLGIAKSSRGFTALNEFLNQHLVDAKPLPLQAPCLPDVFIIYDGANLPVTNLKEYEFAGIRPEQVNRLRQITRAVSPDRLVAWLPVTIDSPAAWNTHRLLRCIANNTLSVRMESDRCCQPTEHFMTDEVLQQIYLPHPALLLRTRQLLESCSCDMEGTSTRNRQHFLQDEVADFRCLTRLARRGLQERYRNPGSRHRIRLDEELRMIRKLRFASYFLITWDIVRYARSRKYRHVGRGSGANSLVAYSLYITDVDPIALNLYFERFINPHRPEPPDFDLDFCWDERDEILHYVRKTHGADRVGLLASYQTFKGKSVVRELGKVYGLTRREIDLMVEQPLARGKHHPMAEVLFREGRHLLTLPSHLSFHSGGIVVTEEPLSQITASQMMPRGLPVLHIDMHHAAAWGLHKFDILSQRGTGHIKEALTLVASRYRRLPDISDMEMISADKKTLSLLQTDGACIGCFYIESPAMRGLLAKVPCRNYLDLVAVSSIIRPGVAKSGMMQEYIRRFHDPALIGYAHPQLASLLEETLGIMVYQEDVMKVVHQLAGFDLYESDLLRRLMTGKKKTEQNLHFLQKKFFCNCLERGVNQEVIRLLWHQIESFSGYSFSKAHSATYAAESLQSLYLKAHYPLEFMVAVIDNKGGFYPTEVYVRELVRLGARVEPPCINRSSWLTRLEGDRVFLGFSLIKGLQQRTGDAILRLRSAGKAVVRLNQIADRIDPAQLDLLIAIGDFRQGGKPRRALLFERLLGTKPSFREQLALFGDDSPGYSPDEPEDPLDQSLAELKLLGFPIRNPFIFFREERLPHIMQKEMRHYSGCRVRMYGYYVIEKPVTTEGGQHMGFTTWIDEELSFFDTVHFPGVYAAFSLRGRGYYRIEGTVVLEYGYPLLQVSLCQAVLLVEELVREGPSLSDYHYLRFKNG
jgi:DNA-directed DNA polymerase III PolC